LLRSNVALVTMLFPAMLDGAAAQTITHEVNGRPAKFDFKPQGQSGPARAQHAPGIISGVPGVDDNRGTHLPSARPAPARNPVPFDRGLTPAPPVTRAQTAPPTTPSPARGNPPSKEKPRVPVRAPEAAHLREPSRVDHSETPRPRTPEALPARTLPPPSTEDAEIRAKIIAEMAAKALAEEQRRLALERARDRRGRHAEPDSSPAPVAERVPDTTGTTGAGVAGAADPASNALVQPSSNKTGVICRWLFFGAC
jgi:hypothetical protein